MGKVLNFLKEAPLNYWEEKSYMLAIPKDESRDILEGIGERIAAIKGVEIKELYLPDEEAPGKLILIYEGEEYEIGFFDEEFHLPEMLGLQSYYFSKEEMEAIKRAGRALTIFMEFHENSKKSFHLQLKLAVAMVPDLLGIVDESAEKLINAKWAKLAAESDVTPAAKDLFMVQAVAGENNEVWLHTHGLCRCGLTELEILNSSRENYNDHYPIISTFASYLLDKKENGVSAKQGVYLGVLATREPIVVTYLPWVDALKEYTSITLGDAKDRKEEHNSKTSVIFLYKSEEDEKNGKVSKVTDYNEWWGKNPIFFISNEETARMKALAMERFHFVKEAAGQEDIKIILKIGLPVDEENREHIWFELLAFEGEKFKAKLIQEPYQIENMHEGDEAWFTVEDVTDWLMYTPKFQVEPGTVYLLV